MAERCRECKYHGTLAGSRNITCDYLLMTGRRRNSDPADCDKFVKGKKEKIIIENCKR